MQKARKRKSVNGLIAESMLITIGTMQSTEIFTYKLFKWKIKHGQAVRSETETGRGLFANAVGKCHEKSIE